eukprot:11087976-Heterocapsa_arctica.AAC.1
MRRSGPSLELVALPDFELEALLPFGFAVALLTELTKVLVSSASEAWPSVSRSHVKAWIGSRSVK